MFDKSMIFFLVAETSIHAGSGEDVGYVDLPIQRNKVTNLPIIQPSELKGSLREFFEIKFGTTDQRISEVFGPEDGSEFASAISFSEARILFFPVKSVYGVFAYITCPLVLNQFLKDAGINLENQIKQVEDEKILIRSSDSIIKIGEEVVLNDFPFRIDNQELPKIRINTGTVDIFDFFKNKIYPSTSEYSYWKENFPKRAAIVSDNTFTTFTEISTEIITRNKIGKGGVVSGEGGGLWNEENLPQETILYSIVSASKPYKKDSSFKNNDEVINFVKDGIYQKRIQLGGHRTVGKGFIFINFLE